LDFSGHFAIVSVLSLLLGAFTLAEYGLLMTSSDHNNVALSPTAASQSISSSVFECSPDAIFIETYEGQILEVNPAACRLHNATREDLVGKFVTDLVPADVRDLVQKEFKGWISGDLTVYEGTSLRKDGSSIPVEIRGTRITYEGEPALLFHVRDISLRHKTEELLHQTEAQLRQLEKMEALGRLAGGIAHDFNNLLTSILGFSQLLLSESGTNTRITDDTKQIIRAAERAADLTKRLLSFSRKRPLDLTTVNLNAIVMRMDKLLRHTLGTDIELITILDDTPATIRGDEGLLEQLIMNLAINSRDAMPSGGKLTIETRSVTRSDDLWLSLGLKSSAEEYLLLIVRDTGFGMSSEVQEHLFEPFFTTKTKEMGTGLGLSTVYRTVQLLDGVINLNSSPGHGAEFLIYFPKTPELVSTGPSVLPKPVPTGNEHILVVEDEPAVRNLTMRILKSLGYRVSEASDGAEALKHCETRTEPLDLLLSDIVMPRLNGRELADELRQLRSGLKVLLMTGFTHQINIEDLKSGTAPPVIHKPFTRESLANAIRDVLDA